MTTAVRTLAGLLPDPVVRSLRSTPLHGLYHALLVRTLDTVEIEVSCGDRSETIAVAEGSNFADEPDAYEPVLSGALCEQLGPSSAFYDVGSQYGYFVALARSAGVPAERIYGFDVNPYALHLLERNFGETDVTVTEGFVADEPGPDAVVLDAFATVHDPPTVVKVDVEGGELAVLRGMETLLAEHRPEIFVEVHPQRIARLGGSDEALIGLLRDADYAMRTTDHREASSDWRPLDTGGPREEGDYLLWASPEGE